MDQLISFDNLLSAALLKFDGEVDNKDLVVLIDMLKRENIFLEDCDSIINKWKNVYLPNEQDKENNTTVAEKKRFYGI